MIAAESNTDHFSTNVRYDLARKQMEGLFLKWISQPTTSKLVHKLLTDVQKTDIILVYLCCIMPFIGCTESAVSCEEAKHAYIAYTCGCCAAEKSKHTTTISFIWTNGHKES